LHIWFAYKIFHRHCQYLFPGHPPGCFELVCLWMWVSLSSFVCRRIAQGIHKLLSLIADKAEVSEVNGDFVWHLRWVGEWVDKCGSKHLDCRWEFSLNFRQFLHAAGFGLKLLAVKVPGPRCVWVMSLWAGSWRAQTAFYNWPDAKSRAATSWPIWFSPASCTATKLTIKWRWLLNLVSKWTSYFIKTRKNVFSVSVNLRKCLIFRWPFRSLSFLQCIVVPLAICRLLRAVDVYVKLLRCNASSKVNSTAAAQQKQLATRQLEGWGNQDG